MSIPQRLGKYPITRMIGEGAMGVVYEAFDPVIHRPLAIKTIRRDLVGGSDAGVQLDARFRNEARAAGRLAHPGIAGVYEYGEDDDCSFIVMEYVPGHTLREYLAQRGALTQADLLSMMCQLLEALAYAHEHGVWHRDIKPANLMVTQEGQLKVTDFGIARIEANGLTMDGALIGTPGYMAPEQFGDDPIDHRVDVYASGALLYQMLAGRLPFTGSIGSVMYRTATEEPAPPSSVEGAQHWAQFDAVVLRAMARDRDLRFQSADEFRRALLAPGVGGKPEAGAQVGAHAQDDETIVVRQPRPARAAPSPAAAAAAAPAAAPSLSPAPAPAPALTQTTGALAWDEATLSRIESALVAQLGPVARVLVRRAAARCADAHTLCGLLAEEHLPAGNDRARFLQAASAGGTMAGGTMAGGVTARGAGTMAGSETARGAGTMTGGASAAGTGPGSRAGMQTGPQPQPLTDAAISHAERVLTQRIGPIARVMVKKAAARSADRAAFHQCLVELAGNSADAGLIGDLQSGPG